jgi:SRSO17 transposase
MLPEIRTKDTSLSLPILDLTPSDIDNFLQLHQEYLANFSECFYRRESVNNLSRYSLGQFLDLRRKSIEPMALHLEDCVVRSLQRFISNGVWYESKLLKIHHKLVEEVLGESRGVLIFDESGTLKKGKESPGTARQYCGNVGKVDNSQVGVFCSYASSLGYTLVNARLFSPQKWFGEPYSERRAKCKYPSDLVFKTKPEIASELFDEIVEEKNLRFRYVAADALYGDNDGFVESLEKYKDKIYYLAISSTRLCWEKKPSVKIITHRSRKNILQKKVLCNPLNKPQTVLNLAQSIKETFWYRRTVSEGTKGPIVYEFTKKRVTLSRNKLPQKRVWLIVKRTLGDNPEYSFYISNASGKTPLKTFVWLSGTRWSIEQCFEEGKSQLGMDHYEGRKYAGWHHHMFVSMLSHFFLWYLKIHEGKKVLL